MQRVSLALLPALAAMACTPRPPGPTELPPCPWPAELGAAAPAGEAVELALALREQGGRATTVSVVGLEDSEPGVFAPLEPEPPVELPPFGEAVLVQRARPAREGTFTRLLQLEASPACQPSAPVALRLTASPAPFEVLGPDALDLGWVPLGYDDITRTGSQGVELVNPSSVEQTAHVEVTPADFTAALVPAWIYPTVFQQLDVAVGPGARYRVAVFYRPRTRGAHQGELRVQVGGRLLKTVALSAREGGPVMQVSAPRPVEVPLVAGAPPEFWPWTDVTVANTGRDPLDVPGAGTDRIPFLDAGTGLLLRQALVLGGKFVVPPRFPAYWVDGGTATPDQGVALRPGEACTVRVVAEAPGTQWTSDALFFGWRWSNAPYLGVRFVPWPACAFSLDTAALRVPGDGGQGTATFTNTGDAGCLVQNPSIAHPEGPFRLLGPLDEQRFVDAGQALTFAVAASPGAADDAGATLVFGATGQRVEVPLRLAP